MVKFLARRAVYLDLAVIYEHTPPEIDFKWLLNCECWFGFYIYNEKRVWCSWLAICQLPFVPILLFKTRQQKIIKMKSIVYWPGNLLITQPQYIIFAWYYVHNDITCRTCEWRLGVLLRVSTYHFYPCVYLPVHQRLVWFFFFHSFDQEGNKKRKICNCN